HPTAASRPAPPGPALAGPQTEVPRTRTKARTKRPAGSTTATKDALTTPKALDKSLPAQGMLERQPLPARFRAGHGLRDEVHAVDAVGDVGVEAVGAVELLAGGAGDHVGIGRGVDVGERFEECFGMSARQAARHLRRVSRERRVRVAREEAVRL